MTKNIKTIEKVSLEPIEKKLWEAADKLRKNIDAAEYKHVVLGLIFLKYISDTFEELHGNLKTGKGEYENADPEDRDEYSAKNINVLKGLEAVRKRPAMYIGDVSSRGLHHLVNEVVDNSIDEALVGYCDMIEVQINKDGSVSVSDNGRGIPVDMHPVEKRSALEVVMTVLHAGGKFDKSSYKVSGGLHGVGVSVVNALSEWLKVEVRRDGKIYFQEYKRGFPVKPVKEIGKTKRGERGTTVTFFPDPDIFKATEFRFDILAERMRELAYLNKNITIKIYN